jgi:hypothetical protein
MGFRLQCCDTRVLAEELASAKTRRIKKHRPNLAAESAKLHDLHRQPPI